MADAVLSVRIDEELKQKFLVLAQENGINNKELMEVMVSQFELAQIGDGSTQFNQDLEELQRITKRMNDIYINMFERTQVRELEIKNKESILRHKQEEEIAALNEKLEIIEQKDKELQGLKDKLKKMSQDFGVLKEEQENIRELNQLLKDKNSQLEKVFADSQAKIEAANQVLEESVKLKALVQDQEALIKRQEFQLQKEIEEQQNLKVKMEEEKRIAIQTLQQEFEFERRNHQLALSEMQLEMKKQAAIELEEVNEKARKQIEELSKEKQDLVEVLKQKNASLD
ncbi:MULTISPECIES: hypothetical protein [Turicibacter]|jgi:hypothetical protein|uniref:Uncharacterized protein n=2 Tax=Turicibacter sanguinis TaxID=154288 RepID=A0A173TX44_9FIRM|nr:MULTISPECIES: hypothetical protein [Turicibacter]EFF63749.1 hypothetical protein CUW_0759 [Turicibacter sanguinis PC909]EGC91865.1 conserved domain protein [Turicibacter sp. HGF1]MBP3904827.1 hypothetical protein [Turicibacter sp.]MCU7191773.1 hypothetical protein [Turicibacter sanguinis]MCU7197829.1 hypothetical protein [Turicibacter sanguinis]